MDLSANFTFLEEDLGEKEGFRGKVGVKEGFGELGLSFSKVTSKRKRELNPKTLKQKKHNCEKALC